MNKFRGGGKILIGAEAFIEVLSSSEINRAFIVCDPFLQKSGRISYITDMLTANHVEYSVFADITPDPSVELVTEGVQVLSEFSPDLVIGFGGGSAIDAAKAMIYFSRRSGMVENVKLIAIPTTSGTGSEVTDFSVITDMKKAMKYPLVDESLLPEIAVLDAELTVSVPKEITAITGMDALTHAIEALVSTNSTDFSDASAEKAIKLIRSYLLTAYKEPENIEARQKMHSASCLSGIAFNNAGLGLNHGMAHALGAKFHIPHGKANAVLLPYVMGFNAGCFDELKDNALLYARIARLIRVDSQSVRQSALNLIRTVKKFSERLDLPANIKSMGISEEEFKEALDSMAEAALNDKCTETNPRKCTVEDIKKIYTHAYFGAVGRSL